MSSVQQTLEEFNDLLDAMQTTLEAEKVALVDRDSQALAHTTMQKDSLCADLANPKFGTNLVTEISDLPQEMRAECERVHADVLCKLRDIQDSNLVNGKILNRSQNSLREILHLLSGRASDGLYGESGQPKHDPESGRDSIARV